MEFIFKKYHTSEQDCEKNYLIYDPKYNSTQFTGDLLKSISYRNFGQNYENILVGPIWDDKEFTVMVLNADGSEAPKNQGACRIFEKYLTDQGYTKSASSSESAENIRAFGTVYYFPA